MVIIDFANDSIRLMLTVRQAAARLGVSYTTLKQWIYKGSVRSTRTDGGHHRIPETEVDRLIERTGVGQGRSAPRRSSGPIVSISGRNQLRGVIEEVRVEGLLAQVRLRIGTERLTAVITRDAVEELRLKRGDEAIAIVKATEVMVAREQEPTPPGRKGRPRRKPPSRLDAAKHPLLGYIR